MNTATVSPFDTYQQGMRAFARLHGMTWRNTSRGWCGHNLAGQPVRSRTHPFKCHQHVGGNGAQWWDHVSGFGMGRKQAVLIGFPYIASTKLTTIVAEYAADLGLNWAVCDPESHLSLYYWGATVPWLLTAPDIDATYLATATSPGLLAAAELAKRYTLTRDDQQALSARQLAKQ